MDTKEALNACADYLEENGWVQFDSVGPDGRSMCSVGVMDEIASTYADQGGDYVRLYDYMRNALRSQIPEGVYPSIPKWNDADGRTKEEVVAAFRGAAASLEG